MPTEKEQKMLALSQLKKKIAPKKVVHTPFLEIVGGQALKMEQSVRSLLEFIGDITVSFARLLTGKAFFAYQIFFWSFRSVVSERYF